MGFVVNRYARGLARSDAQLNDVLSLIQGEIVFPGMAIEVQGLEVRGIFQSLDELGEMLLEITAP